MAKIIMVQGTASNAGKSIVVAALCRIFRQDGYRVAPFKSQNMALNSFITKDGNEMGRAQAMQAEACDIDPDVRMNPILLKPTGDKKSQVVLNGKVLRKDYDYHDYKDEMIPHIMKAFNSLSDEYDIIVIEGAGSPAEINLKKQDIVNMGMAKLVDAPVIIVGDIDRGGVFASLAGTMLLLDDEDKKRVKGFIINKFRGNYEILKPGIEMFENIVNTPILGVIPYLKVDIDDEDSLSDRFLVKSNKKLVDIAVIRLPHISNFTDFNIFSIIEDVSLRYVSNLKDLEDPDMIIIPGTKNTIEDLKWLRESGLEEKIKRHANNKKPVFGICGGYQILGKTINDSENVESGEVIKGMGLLDIETTFFNTKTTTQVQGVVNKVHGYFEKLSGLKIKGYEIHMGNTNNFGCENLSTINVTSEHKNIEKFDGSVSDNIAGSYIHGIFDNSEIAEKIIKIILKNKGIERIDKESFDFEKYKKTQYDILADAVRNSIDMKKIYEFMGLDYKK